MWHAEAHCSTSTAAFVDIFGGMEKIKKNVQGANLLVSSAGQAENGAASASSRTSCVQRIIIATKQIIHLFHVNFQFQCTKNIIFSMSLWNFVSIYDFLRFNLTRHEHTKSLQAARNPGKHQGGLHSHIVNLQGCLARLMGMGKRCKTNMSILTIILFLLKFTFTRVLRSSCPT